MIDKSVVFQIYLSHIHQLLYLIFYLDYRFGGGIASAVGKTWNPGDNMKTPVKEWIHVAAVFRQNGESYVFLNGERSENTVIAQNDYGLSSLWIGRPHHAGHWTDCWIKEVKVFGRALSDEDVKVLSEMFFEDEGFHPLKCPDGSVEIGQVAHGLSSPNVSLFKIFSLSK